MEKEEVWDIYFSKLHGLLTSKRLRIEDLIEEETGKEMGNRWPGVNIEAYTETAISFIEERLYAYGLDSLKRFLTAVSYDASLADLGSLDLSLSWYDWRKEKEEIDAKIEKGLNIMQPKEEIVKEVLDEFGAFPTKSIIGQYQQKPEKNRLPDYALAAAIQRVIRERSWTAFS